VRLEFLPYHFLLAAGNSKGYLKYLDTSVGKFVSGMQTGGGCLNVMTQNPKSGVIMLGNPQGTVTFWSPSSQKALASVLTNRCAVRSLASTSCGTYIATGSVDRTVSIWDIRMMKELQSYRTSTVPSHLAFSQRNQLAVSLGLVLDVYPNNAIQERVTSPYMTQRLPSPISGLEFCPYEDVLGVTHRTGYGKDSL
jgi:U3 small nucleolar RNA-associated protein 7